MNQNNTEYRIMPNENNFKPQKKWEQTSTGYYIVPTSELDVKGVNNDGKNKPNLKALGMTIVRCRCPDCSDSRKHKKEHCVRLDLATGMGKMLQLWFPFYHQF